jgi:hypothetical protein
VERPVELREQAGTPDVWGEVDRLLGEMLKLSKNQLAY